jgi:AraC-like DNA-binding protein
MLDYREFAPSPTLADRIECFWTMRLDGPATTHRVVPDGCSDILLTLESSVARVESVGPMTTWRDHPVLPGCEMFGARFRPGRGPLPPVIDSVHALEDHRLLDRLQNAASTRERARLIEACLPPRRADKLDAAIAHLGRMRLDDLARAANLSPRQFRRVVEARTGYTPKLLARIVRCRAASARLARGEAAAVVAVDCGYYDQAHLINEMRALAGRTSVFSA